MKKYTEIKTYLDACQTLKRSAHIRFLYQYLDSNTRSFYMLRIIAEAISRMSSGIDDANWVVTFQLSGNHVQTSVNQLTVVDAQHPFIFPDKQSARYFEGNFTHLMRSVLI